MPNPSLPPRADTIIFARWIIPIEPAQTIYEQHALVIDAGRIVGLLPAEQARTIAADNIVELDNHALLPGLVNAHGHAAMTLLRGYADDYALHSWLNDHIWPAEGQWVSEAFVRDGTELAIAEMLRSGTTCFADMYFFPEAIAQIAHELHMRAHIHLPVIGFPTAWAHDADEYIHKDLVVRDNFKHHELISTGFGPHAPYTLDDAALSRIAVLAAELDCTIQIHVHETQHEVDESLAQFGERPLARLSRLGLLGPRTQCVHATALDASDIELLAENNCHVVHCPESNLKLASGFCPVQKLRDAGVNVALGTDGAASNNDLDLFSEMRTAAMLTKAIAQNPSALPAFDALRMATLDGAKALGLDDKIGSLEIGKCADVIAVDLSAIEQQPLFNPLSQLVYTHSGANVSHSWVNGKALLANREFTTINLADLRTRVTAWQQKIIGARP